MKTWRFKVDFRTLAGSTWPQFLDFVRENIRDAVEKTGLIHGTDEATKRTTMIVGRDIGYGLLRNDYGKQAQVLKHLGISSLKIEQDFGELVMRQEVYAEVNIDDTVQAGPGFDWEPVMLSPGFNAEMSFDMFRKPNFNTTQGIKPDSVLTEKMLKEAIARIDKQYTEPLKTEDLPPAVVTIEQLQELKRVIQESGGAKAGNLTVEDIEALTPVLKKLIEGK